MCVPPQVLPMADNSTGGKKTVFFSRIKSKRSKDRGKPEKDPPDVAQSSVAAAVAQSKDKQSSKAKKEEKKTQQGLQVLRLNEVPKVGGYILPD